MSSSAWEGERGWNSVEQRGTCDASWWSHALAPTGDWDPAEEPESGERATCRDEGGNPADPAKDQPQTTKCPESQYSKHEENRIYA